MICRAMDGDRLLGRLLGVKREFHEVHDSVLDMIRTIGLLLKYPLPETTKREIEVRDQGVRIWRVSKRCGSGKKCLYGIEGLLDK